MAKAEKPVRRALAVGSTAMLTVKQVETIPLERGFRAEVNGLVVEGEPKFEAWEKAVNKLRVIEKGAQFTLGDAIIWGETHFDERASQVLDAESGWSLKTVSIYRWLSSRIAKEDRRMDRLGVAHHLLVAALTPAKQREWLGRAADDEEEKPWTVGRLRAALKEGEDLPPSDFYVLARCDSAEQQSGLMDRLEAEGFGVKAVQRRQRKAAAADAA